MEFCEWHFEMDFFKEKFYIVINIALKYMDPAWYPSQMDENLQQQINER